MIKARRNRTTKIDEEFYVSVPVPSRTVDPSSVAPPLLDAFLAGRKEETIKSIERTWKTSRISSRHPPSTKPLVCSWLAAWARRTLSPWPTRRI
jgi:hypothetical protein